ncbi:MAG TPA: site-2 protease family protein [Terriglobales bacterium]|nr:site-2 protease family protein [Terriglobales bacterium]
MPDPILPLSSTTEYYSPVEVFVVRPPRPRYWLHGLLLLVTIFTTLVVGARMQFNFQHNLPALTAGDEYIPFFPVEWVFAKPSRILMGIPFSMTLLFILLAHEMGHYLYCRYYRVHATLPFFIPAPTLIGTLGAVIRIKSPIRSRAALFDIGIAGPIAGFLVAVSVLLVSLTLSKPVVPGMAPADIYLGYPIIFDLAHRLLAVFAPMLGVSSVPLTRIYLHPTAVAAWVGMFATALNLLPSGQLDGGHIVYALWPRAHRAVSWITVFALIYLGKQYIGWRMWAGLVAAMNIVSWRQRQAPDVPGVQGWRWVLALLALLMLILTLTPVPFSGSALNWN